MQVRALEAVAAQLPANETCGMSWEDQVQDEADNTIWPVKGQARAWALLLQASSPDMHVPFLLTTFDTFWRKAHSVQHLALCLHALASSCGTESNLHLGDVLSMIMLLRLGTSRFFMEALLVPDDANEPRGKGAILAMQYLIDTVQAVLSSREELLQSQLKELRIEMELPVLTWYCPVTRPGKP